MYVTLYHYTDADGALGIMESGCIFMSKEDDYRWGRADAVAGDGVYLTDKAPHHYSKMSIARDIFQDRSLPRRMVQAGRVNYAIKVKVKRNRVVEAIKERHVWLYPGRDLHLTGPDVRFVDLLQCQDDEYDDQSDWYRGASVRQRYM